MPKRIIRYGEVCLLNPAGLTTANDCPDMYDVRIAEKFDSAVKHRLERETELSESPLRHLMSVAEGAQRIARLALGAATENIHSDPYAQMTDAERATQLERLGIELAIEDGKLLKAPKFPRFTESEASQGFVEEQEYHRMAEAAGKLWLRALLGHRLQLRLPPQRIAGPQGTPVWSPHPYHPAQSHRHQEQKGQSRIRHVGRLHIAPSLRDR